MGWDGKTCTAEGRLANLSEHNQVVDYMKSILTNFLSHMRMIANDLTRITDILKLSSPG